MRLLPTHICQNHADMGHPGLVPILTRGWRTRVRGCLHPFSRNTEAEGLSEGFAQSRERFDATVSGEAIGFGADDEVGPPGALQEFEELRVAGFWWNGAVDKADAQRQGGAFTQVGVNELWPLGGDGSGKLRVSVAGQIGKEKLRLLGGLLGPGTAGKGKEVNGAGAAWRRGDASLLLVEERINEAGFADIGAAEEGDLGRPGFGEMRFGGRGGQEFGIKRHHCFRAQSTNRS